MATVLERFKKLGIPYSNPVLQLAGEVFWVNDYPNDLSPDIDFEIINWISHKPDRHEREWLRN